MDKIHNQGKWLLLCERDGWEFASRKHRCDVVIIVALTDQHELLLVEQYRVPVQAATIELPAGLVGDIAAHSDESLQQAAMRELEEVTGLGAESLQLLMSGPTSAGLSDEQVHMFRAHGCRQTGPGGGDASEDITVHRIAVTQLPQWLQQQQEQARQVDPKIYAALYWINPRSA
jgi:ADP-ribose pyrophosphatase